MTNPFAGSKPETVTATPINKIEAVINRIPLLKPPINPNNNPADQHTEGVTDFRN